MRQKPKHDELTKNLLTNQVAARELLEHYLPADLKELIDLTTISVDKESFIDDKLRKHFSDIIYNVKTTDNNEAFIYIAIEEQSTPDYWLALRLWKYALLLLERHKKKKNKLPLIYQMVIYNGKEAYTVPRNLWDLFEYPQHAKKLLTGDYHLIDLESTSNDEIVKKKYLGMLEFMLKNIHDRDTLKLWDEFLTHFKADIIFNKERGYIYLRAFLYYTDCKLPEEKQGDLEQIITKHLSQQDKDTLMRTIAQKYIDEGIQYGIAQGREEGIEKGIAQGREEGIERRNIEIAKNLLRLATPISLISEVTGLTESFILSLKQS